MTSDYHSHLDRLLLRIHADLDLRNARLSSGHYYQSLPLAIIDAVFSLGVRYESAINAVLHFSRFANWQVYRPHSSPLPPANEQRTTSDLLSVFAQLAAPDQAPEVLFGNRGYANPAARAAKITKATLVRRIAEILSHNGVQTFQDFVAAPSVQAIDDALRSLPSMGSGLVISYLRMLSGDEIQIKPDRHLHAFVREAIGSTIIALSNETITRLVRDAALSLASSENLGFITPRLLDHEIWRHQRSVVRKYEKRNEPPLGDMMPDLQRAPSPTKTHCFGIREGMGFEEFWKFCAKGGTTEKSLAYQVDDKNRLHILSPRSKLSSYRITKETVATYLEKVHDVRFRANHGWFCSVHDEALRSSRE